MSDAERIQMGLNEIALMQRKSLEVLDLQVKQLRAIHTMIGEFIEKLNRLEKTIGLAVNPTGEEEFQEALDAMLRDAKTEPQ